MFALTICRLALQRLPHCNKERSPIYFYASLKLRKFAKKNVAYKVHNTLCYRMWLWLCSSMYVLVVFKPIELLIVKSKWHHCLWRECPIDWVKTLSKYSYFGREKLKNKSQIFIPNKKTLSLKQLLYYIILNGLKPVFRRSFQINSFSFNLFCEHGFLFLKGIRVLLREK